MSKCENLEKCPFYQGKMQMDSGLGKIYRTKYCEGDKNSCARYKVSKTVGSQYVTNNLYPNMDKKAEEIINANK